MAKNKARGARILAEQRKRAEAKRRPTFAAALEKRGMVEHLERAVQDINQRAVTKADQAGRVQLKVISCHTCTAPKGCCKITTFIFLHDAVPIVARLKRDRRDTPELMMALRAAAEKMEQTSRNDYEAPCVFLDAAERCSVYDVRPATCGTALVFSPPETCSEWMTGTITRFNDDEFSFQSTILAKELYDGMGLVDRAGRSVMGVLPRMILVCLEAWDRTDYQTFLVQGDWAIRATRTTGEGWPHGAAPRAVNVP